MQLHRGTNRLASNGAMSLFLCDSVRVISRPTSSGETLDMKTYTMKIFNSQAKLPFPILKHCDQDEFLLCLIYLEKGEPYISMG